MYSGTRRYGEHTQHRSNCLGVFCLWYLSRSLGSEVLDSPEVIFLQPIWQFGILTFGAAEFDERNYCIRVPVYLPVLTVAANEVRNGGIGGFSHIPLVMKFIPKFTPYISKVWTRF